MRAAIRARNRDVSGGDLDSGKRRYLLRTIGRFDNVEALENLVIAERDGSFIRLRDLGYAELGFAEVRNYAYSEGKPVLSFAVNRQIGSNVIAIKRDMLATVAELNAGVLQRQGLRLVRTADDVVYVADAVTVVQRNLAIGASLAILVLFLFLRSLPATLIGAIGIPICTVAAFLGLLIAGRTINVISLAGVAFAIGMTLDNNIVVLENIYRHLNMGKQRLRAALDGVREVWPAVLASTLTTVAVFLPVIFIEEEAGQLYSDIAIAISGSILMSMIVAVALVPAAAGRLLRQQSPASRRKLLTRIGAAFSRQVMGGVRWITRGIVRPLMTLLLVLAGTAAILYHLTPDAEYLPGGEESKIFTLMFAPPGYNIDMMRAAFREVDRDFVPAVGQDPGAFARGENEVPALNFSIGFANESRVFVVREATDRRQTDALMAVSRLHLFRQFRRYPQHQRRGQRTGSGKTVRGRFQSVHEGAADFR